MTVHKLSAGDGYAYYTNEVATGDQIRDKTRELGDYYTVDGMPPGQWGGLGAAHLGVSGEVSEAQMAALFGEGIHPDAAAMIAGGADEKDVRLGQRFRRPTVADETLNTRTATALADHERRFGAEPDADTRRQIRAKVAGQLFRETHGRNPASAEELGRFQTIQAKPTSQTVAGYDLVFAPAKSVSVLWGVGGQDARHQIEAAHYEAIEETMRWLEKEATYTRRGRNGVRVEDVDGGLVYTRFRHYDSRSGDPQLHDHVVVSNKVRGADGKWSALDGRPLYQFGVAASERYNRLVTQKVCERLGVGTVRRYTAGGDRPVYEIAGVPVDAIEAASTRRGSIDAELARLRDEFVERNGYEPSKKQQIALAQQATLATRPHKPETRRLADLVEGWTETYGQLPGVQVGAAAVETAREHRFDGLSQMVRAGEPEPVAHAAMLDPMTEAREVIARLELDRGVWGEQHVIAETTRRLTARLGGQAAPDDLHAAIVEAALNHHSLSVTPQEARPTLEALSRADGVSKYTRPHRRMWTSAAVIASEDRLLTAAGTTVIPAAVEANFQAALARQDVVFNAGQLAMAREFATSGKLLSLGIGPAGAGKTTALRLTADTVRQAGGNVIGLAPTAAAAKVMSDELGATATTIDAFVLAHQPGARTAAAGGAGPVVQPGDVIILDEAGMVSTRLFAEAVTIAEAHGAVVRALGDDQQLSAVGAGGALRLLDRQTPAVHLEDLHRFRTRGEDTATLALREPPAVGTDDPWGFYREHGRLQAGDKETMTSAVYEAWQADTIAGKNAIMAASDNATVTELNARAQAFRLSTGELDPTTSAPLRDGLAAHVGDLVVTRRNDRRMGLHEGKDFVKNGDVWTVEAIRPDGSLAVTHTGHHGAIDLPAEYVAQNTMLGYAHTIHRTQGTTCDTTHALVDSRLSRSLAYVAGSRGRESNRFYVALGDGETMTEALASIAGNHDTNLTAHEVTAAARVQARATAPARAALVDVEVQANEARAAVIVRTSLAAPAAGAVLADADGLAHLAETIREAHEAGYDVEALTRDAWDTRAGDPSLFERHHPADALAWRIHQRVETGTEIRAAATERPLAGVSDEHLNRLAGRARANLTAVEREAGDTVSAPAGTTAPWHRRLYGHLSDESLAARLQENTDACDRLVPSAADRDDDARRLAWVGRQLADEQATRAAMAPDRAAEETYQRGPAGQARGTGPADAAQARVWQHRAVLSRLEREQRLRSLVPAARPDHTTSQGRPVLPAWVADRTVLADIRTPAAWRVELSRRHTELAAAMTRRGGELALTPPTWANELGPIPRDT
ncbi:MobF family relaxase, partial [Tersicoccus sp. Bi-70]|uniref:MobF family relaxase n=1 Tax=Tersicoccus sp. Bi-70 TaxID=1897634 RepID=UPI000976D8C2